jgi:RNA polymerase sigma factor (sigma-70 family)
MALGVLTELIPRLRGAVPPESDADLLDRFVSERDAAAFEALVRRHGPMVFGVCRRVLRHTQDAEDATQATFLVLLRKAAAVLPRSKLAGWLHVVAHTTALKARGRAARRTEVESRVPVRSEDAMAPDPTRDEAEAVLDQELAALPDRYRLPIILCDLEGRTRAEVAATLRCAEGTLSSRLTRGRRMLAERLKRRGVQLSAGALAALLTEVTVAAVEPLVRSLSPAALATVTPTVAGLATGVMKGMFLKKLQTAVTALAVGALVAAAAFGLAALAPEPTQAAAPVPPKPPVDEKAEAEALADLDTQLLLNRKVIKELKCDIDQLDKIMDTIEAGHEAADKITNDALAKITADPNGGNDPNFDKAVKEAAEAGDKEIRKAVSTVVTTMLTAAQRKRLREIDLQYRGYEAFGTPAVAKELNLTDKQKEQLAANVKRVQEGVQRALEEPAGPNGMFNVDYAKVMKDARADGLKGALDVLTAEQKALWKKMNGEPVKFRLPQPDEHPGPFGNLGGASGAGGAGGFRPVPLPGVVPVPPKTAPPAVQEKPEK